MKTQEQAPVNTSQKVKQASKAGQLTFVLAFMLLCVLPFAGLAFAPNQVSSDEDTLSAAPVIMREDGSPNLEYLSDAGDYFEDHFAFRTMAIDLNARLRVGLFATSPTEQVIVGDQGWLYYGGTLANYKGSDPLSEREILNISHNLELIQGYTEAQGASFVLAIAPNKNTLYPQHMPYYYQRGSDDSMQRLMQALDSRGITYVDLFALFNEQNDELYLKTDTHWTEEGAALVSKALLEVSGQKPAAFEEDSESARIIGDLELMLYPVTANEEESSALVAGDWRYTGEAESVEDAVVNTQGEGEDSLVMYRDSFANSLIPLMAPQFAKAHFTKLIPFDLAQIQATEADVVVIERAERNLDLLGEDAPFMLAPTFSALSVDQAIEIDSDGKTESEIAWHADGDYRVIQGWVDDAWIEEDSRIFIAMESPAVINTTAQEKNPLQGTTVFVPFYVTTELKSYDEGKESDTIEQQGLVEDGGIATETAASKTNKTPYGFKLYLDEHSLTSGSYTFRVLVLDEATQELRTVMSHALTY